MSGLLNESPGASEAIGMSNVTASRGSNVMPEKDEEEEEEGGAVET
jgi:hypothetical protein